MSKTVELEIVRGGKRKVRNFQVAAASSGILIGNIRVWHMDLAYACGVALGSLWVVKDGAWWLVYESTRLAAKVRPRAHHAG